MNGRRIGLVLDGGGGKGAYQIGVWKALRELGWDRNVTAIAGTSVGGLNAALFVQGSYENAEDIWLHEISGLHVTRLQMNLEKLIDKFIDTKAFSQSSIDCFLATHCAGQKGEYCEYAADGRSVEKYVNGEMSYHNLRVVSEKDCGTWLKKCSTPKAVMLATSALPLLCRKVRIGSRLHEDGGVPWGGDNSPVYPLLGSSACDEIIVIHLDVLAGYAPYDKQRYREQGIAVHEILPSVPLDQMGLLTGTLNFKPEHAARLIEAGYRDSMSVFKSYLQIDTLGEKARKLEQQKLAYEAALQKAKAYLLENR